MLTLFLDTASRKPLAALCSNEKTLAQQSFESRSDAAVIPAIVGVLKEAGLEYKDLTRLACAIGPGGFTSLRIGATAINTLAYALDLPSAGAHLSEVWKARVVGMESHFWFHSTRKTQLFVRGVGGFFPRYPEPTLIDLEEAAVLNGPYVGELIEEHEKALKGCEPLENLRPLEEVLPDFLSNLEFKRRQLQPWYGRSG